MWRFDILEDAPIARSVEDLGRQHIVYAHHAQRSKEDDGKQVRLVANSGIVKNRPLYLPELIDPRGLSDESATPACTLHDGVLMTNRQAQ